ncbi:MAG: hypothetical protein ABW123_26915 [Cystobacter sp.]
MTIFEALAGATLFIGARQRAAEARGRQDEEKLWRYVRALNHFVLITGQIYRFEDSLEGKASEQRPSASARLGMPSGTLAELAMDLLRKTLDETPEPEQKQHLSLLIALLDFIAGTGQLDEAEDYFIHQLEQAPMAIAHFARQEDAEAWMNSVAEPPSPVRILIGDTYYQFWYTREDNTRGMYREYCIEPALEALAARGIPPRTPSFATRVEAEEWLTSHPAHPYAFVAIAGEQYFAVHHSRLKRHSLHHVASTLNDWEYRKKAVELDTAREAAAPSDGDDE